MIIWKGVEYPSKRITIFKGTAEEVEVVVSVERLEHRLIDDLRCWATREAADIDAKIDLYLNEELFNMPDNDIVKFLEEQ